jgi:hypothetical protein
MNADERTQMNAGIFSTILAAAAAVFAAGAASAATPVPPGKWSFVWKDEKGRADKPLRVYTYRPRACDTTCPIVFVMAGMKRNASAYRDYWELSADRYKVLVVAPEFSRENWPRAAAYNLGDIQAGADKSAFATVERLFDEVRDGQKSYVLFGHSAGGQFAHRMALLYPNNRASVIVAANPGWYTMPEWRKEKAADPFPYSMVNAPSGVAELAQTLGKRVILLVGEKDDDPDDENLSKTDGAMKQGPTRLERGENFFKAATTAANDLGVKLAWELVEVPDVAHNGESMSRIAADTLYRK